MTERNEVAIYFIINFFKKNRNCIENRENRRNRNHIGIGEKIGIVPSLQITN